MSLYVYIQIQDKSHKVLKKYAEMSKYLLEKISQTQSSEENPIVVEGISSESFQKCMEFCEYYTGITPKDQEFMKKDTLAFMTNSKYLNYSNYIKKMFDKLNKESLCDVMNTAEKLNIGALIDIMSYILYEIMKKPKGDILKILYE